MKCAHCGAPKALHRWTLQACADGRKKRHPHLCDPCDVELNRLVLDFIGDTATDSKVASYAARSAETGRYVSGDTARKNLKTTVRERVKGT